MQSCKPDPLMRIAVPARILCHLSNLKEGPVACHRLGCRGFDSDGLGRGYYIDGQSPWLFVLCHRFDVHKNSYKLASVEKPL